MLDKRYLTLSLLGKTRSYTATAKQLFMTQPAVSQQINSLETELNLKLVNYAHQQLTITPAGLRLIDFIDKTQSEANKILTDIGERTEMTTLRIGATRSVAVFLLPKLIQRIDQRHQNIKTVIGNTDDLLAALRSGKVDFGLIEGNFDKSEFDAVKIRTEPFVGVMGGKNIAVSEVDIASLLTQPLIIREEGSGTRDIFTNWLSTQNLALSDFDRQIEVASPMAIINILKAGVGISFMYESLVKRELATHELHRLNVQGFNVHHPINLIYLKDSYFTDDYKRFANLIK